MKKLVLGIVIGLLIGGVPVWAWSQHQEAQPITGFDCSGPYYETSDGQYWADKNGNRLPDNADPIPNPKGTDGRCSGTVYVFDDGNYHCYIAKATGTGISCLKK